MIFLVNGHGALIIRGWKWLTLSCAGSEANYLESRSRFLESILHFKAQVTYRMKFLV